MCSQPNLRKWVGLWKASGKDLNRIGNIFYDNPRSYLLFLNNKIPNRSHSIWFMFIQTLNMIKGKLKEENRIIGNKAGKFTFLSTWNCHFFASFRIKNPIFSPNLLSKQIVWSNYKARQFTFFCFVFCL